MFRNLSPYGDTRPTALPWAPTLPRHWRIERAKTVMRTVDVRSAAGEEELLTVSSKRGVVPRASAKVSMFRAESYVGHKLCWPDDLVINSLWAWGRGLGVARHHGIVSTAYGVYRQRKADLDPSYLNELVRSEPFQWELQVRSQGVWKSRLQISDERWLDAPLLVPPADEQAAIVKYLAHANARIDKAIAAKRRLIALVEEQQRTLLNERMLSTSSGDLVPVKALLRPVRSVVGESHRQKTLLSLTLRGVIPRDLVNAKGKFPSDFSTYQDLLPGQFVFCLFDVDETPRTVGLSRVEGMITGAYDVFEPVDPSASEYLELFFTAMDNLKAYRPLYTGLRKVLPRDRFLRTVVPFPGEEIRQSVVGEIRASMAESEAVVKRVSHEISLMQEFRTRLVADVVTGQVDVRGIAATLPEAPESFDIVDSALDDDLEQALSEGED